MKPLASQPEPEREDWTETVLSAINAEFDAGTELVKLLSEHLPEHSVRRACELVGILHDKAAAQRAAFVRELAWQKWVMARYYFRLTGKHVELGPRSGTVNHTAATNIVDIRTFVRAKKRGL